MPRGVPNPVPPADRPAPPAAAVRLGRAPAPDRTVPLFWGLVAAHVLLFTLVGALTQPSLPLDAAEMVAWGHQWRAGYHKHPPLPCWVAEGLWSTFRTAWPLYLFSQLCTAATLWAVWRLGRRLLTPWAALAAAACLELSYYSHLTTLDVNHTILCRPCWALFVWWLYEAVTRNRLRHWALAGLAVGLGMLSKYYMAAPVLAACALPLVDRTARSRLAGAGPWVTLAFACAVFSPHAVWLVANDFPTVAYVLRRGDVAEGRAWDHLWQPVLFVLSQAGVWGPMLLCLWPLMTGRPVLRPAALDRLPRRWLALATLVPPGLYLFAAAATGGHVRAMWGGPLFSVAGVFALVFAEKLPAWARVSLVRPADPARWAVRLGAASLVGCALFAGVRNAGGPHLRGKASRVHTPGPAIAAAVESAWAEVSDDPVPVVGGPYYHAALANAHATDPSRRPRLLYDFDPAASPWTSDAEINARGAVIVWDERGDILPVPRDLQARFPAMRRVGVVDLPYLTGGDVDPLPLVVNVVPPAATVRVADGSGTAKRR